MRDRPRQTAGARRRTARGRGAVRSATAGTGPARPAPARLAPSQPAVRSAPAPPASGRAARGGAAPGGAAPRSRTAGGFLGGEQVEGFHAVWQLLVAGRRDTHALWVDRRLVGASGPLSELVALARRLGVPVELKSACELLAVAQTGAPQGVVAWADPIPALTLDELLDLVEPAPENALVVLDQVTDPGNLGAVLRTAVCAGAGGLVVGRHRSASLSPAALKAAAGAAELVPVCRAPGIPAALATIRTAGWWVVGLAADADEELWTSRLLDEPVALVLGSEGRGLSRLSRQRCDLLVRVPMAPGAASVGSLNVAAACAVACFELARRRRRSSPDEVRAKDPS